MLSVARITLHGACTWCWHQSLKK